MWAPALMAASMVAPLVTSAYAWPPLKPPTDTFRMSASALASLSPTAWTFTDVELVMFPLSVADVEPETMARGSMTSIAMPPTLPPGALDTAMLVEVAATVTAPPTDSPVPPLKVALVVRLVSALAMVSPAAKPPVETLSVWMLGRLVPFAVTLTPPPTVPNAFDEAEVWPRILPKARAPASAPAMPPCALATMIGSEM